MTKYIRAFLSAALLGAMVTWAAHADALQRRTSAHYCNGQYLGYNNIGGIYNESSTYTAYPYCSFMSDTYLSHASVERINVHVLDSHSTQEVGAKACVAFYGSLGGACGPVNWTNSTGVQYLELTGTSSGQDLYYWNIYSVSFPYIHATLPPCDGFNCSFLFGYVAQDTL